MGGRSGDTIQWLLTASAIAGHACYLLCLRSHVPGSFSARTLVTSLCRRSRAFPSPSRLSRLDQRHADEETRTWQVAQSTAVVTP